MFKLIVISLMTLALLTLGTCGFELLTEGAVDTTEATKRLGNHLGAILALTMVLIIVGYGHEEPYSGGGSGDSGL